MYLSLTTYAIEFLQGIVNESSDLEELSYFEGAFQVLFKLNQNDADCKALFREYLSDFIRADGIERELLTEKAPRLLADLERMLETATEE